MGVDVAGVLFAVWPDGGIPPFPEFLIDLGDTARASLAPLTFVSLEGAVGGFSRSGPDFYLRISFTDALIDLHRRCPAHLIGDVGVDVQCGAAGDVPDDGGECFHVHAVFQTGRAENVPEIVKPNLFAPSSL